VAFVSDAGTPGVSDPGARLVAAVVAGGHRVAYVLRRVVTTFCFGFFKIDIDHTPNFTSGPSELNGLQFFCRRGKFQP
jgi:hypothetical protein